MSTAPASVQTLAPDTSPDRLAADGAVIVADLMSPEVVAEVTAGVRPYIERSPYGDDFSGRQTQRTPASGAIGLHIRRIFSDY